MSQPSPTDPSQAARPRGPGRGRGAVVNPPNRFVGVQLERDLDYDSSEEPDPRTQFIEDHAVSIVTTNDSPDLGFEASLNPYRGCEHGCAYCYARPTHEYAGYSAGLDFETRILVKMRAGELLRRELAARAWKPKVLAMSGVTDCYQPAERRFRVTRACLEVLAESRNPVGIVTKNALVARDLDLLGELARFQAVAVFVSLTTLDPQLQRVMEPRTASPRARLETMQRLAQAGVPVGVMTAPVIPALNDHELPNLLRAAADHGARYAGYVVLRLPYAVAPLFEQWLERHYPERREKVLNQLRSMREGRLNDPRFGSRMAGQGPAADRIRQWFDVGCRRAGLNATPLELSTASFRRPALDGQLDLL